MVMISFMNFASPLIVEMSSQGRNYKEMAISPSYEILLLLATCRL